MKMTTVSGAAIAAAAAGLLLSGATVTPAGAAMPAMGHCMKANACKGLSACKGGSPGMNACKGQGFAMTAEEQCKKAGFKFESM